MGEIVARLSDVSHEYLVGDSKVQALDCVSMSLHSGESVSIMGRSGSGKSTLVGILAGLRKPTSGQVWIVEEEADRPSTAMIFQAFHLDSKLTALENMMVSWYLGVARKGSSSASAKRDAIEILEELEIPELANRSLDKVSGGQRQRIAIARALFARPRILIADEPTGNLDEYSADAIAEVLYRIPASSNTSLVVVTHDLAIANRADRTATLLAGELTWDSRMRSPG